MHDFDDTISRVIMANTGGDARRTTNERFSIRYEKRNSEEKFIDNNGVPGKNLSTFPRKGGDSISSTIGISVNEDGFGTIVAIPADRAAMKGTRSSRGYSDKRSDTLRWSDVDRQ